MGYRTVMWEDSCVFKFIFLSEYSTVYIILHWIWWVQNQQVEWTRASSCSCFLVQLQGNLAMQHLKYAKKLLTTEVCTENGSVCFISNLKGTILPSQLIWMKENSTSNCQFSKLPFWYYNCFLLWENLWLFLACIWQFLYK